jgi:SNF2 family DNA or RNA helicase
MSRFARTGKIARRAIRRFMARPRDDWTRFLRLSERALNIRMKELPVRPPVWTSLQKHQRALFLIGASLKRFAYFCDTGTGKTFLSIALQKYFMKTDEARVFLVLVPNISNKWEWAVEGYDKHAPDVNYCVLTGSSKEKWAQIADSDATVFIETYVGLLRMVCDLKKDKRKKAKKESRLIPNRTKVAKLTKMMEGVFCDESTFLKNRDKLPYRIAFQLSKTARVFFILTGTPFGRKPLDLWAQLNLVDHGYTLGETLGLFRNAFFIGTQSYWGGMDWKFNSKLADTLNKFLNHRSIVLEADEADLPKLVPIKKFATLDETAEAYYERAKEMIKASRGDYQEMKNAFLRARQISSGFVGFKNDETGERASYVFEEQPKLDALEDFITERIKRGEKFVVFHEFKFSGKRIVEMLERNSIKCLLLNGDTHKNDVPRIKDDFKNKKSIDGLVLSNSAGGFGLNLQHAKYGLYFEAPVDPIMRKQTMRRFERQFSDHGTVFCVDFIVRGTADETILSYHAEGRALWRSILNIGRPKERAREREDA